MHSHKPWTKTRTLSRRTLIGLGIVSISSICATRIGLVNIQAVPQPPVVHYQMGEWIDLNGSFIELADIEQTSGYAVRISNAQAISPQEYIEQYTVEPSALNMVNDYDGNIAECAVKSLVCLTMDVKNTGSTGQICFAEMFLVAEKRRNEYFLPEVGLFISSEKKYADSGANYASAYFGVKPGTQYTIHMPYIHGSLIGNGWTYHESPYLNPIADKTFSLILSYLPIRMLVDITID